MAECADGRTFYTDISPESVDPDFIAEINAQDMGMIFIIALNEAILKLYFEVHQADPELLPELNAMLTRINLGKIANDVVKSTAKILSTQAPTPAPTKVEEPSKKQVNKVKSKKFKAQKKKRKQAKEQKEQASTKVTSSTA